MHPSSSACPLQSLHWRTHLKHCSYRQWWHLFLLHNASQNQRESIYKSVGALSSWPTLPHVSTHVAPCCLSQKRHPCQRVLPRTEADRVLEWHLLPWAGSWLWHALCPEDSGSWAAFRHFSAAHKGPVRREQLLSSRCWSGAEPGSAANRLRPSEAQEKPGTPEQNHVNVLDAEVTFPI